MESVERISNNKELHYSPIDDVFDQINKENHAMELESRSNPLRMGKMGGYYLWWMHDAAKCLSIFE